MFHAQSSFLDRPPLPLPHGAPSPLFTSHGDIHCDPRLRGQSGRVAEQSLPAGFEPNDLVEVSSKEVSPVLSPSRRASVGSTDNSGEDVDERQSMGMLASPLFAQKREASAAPSRNYHSEREDSVSSSPHIPAMGKPVAMYSHKRKSSRDPKSLQESFSQGKRIFAEHREQAALSKLSEAEYHTGILLEEQRNQILSEARSQMSMQDFFLKKNRKCRHGSP